MECQKRTQQKEKGQSLVELAVTATFMILLLGGVIDLGRAFFSFLSLRDAAEEGALYGSYNPTDATGLKNRVRLSSDNPINLSSLPLDHINIQYTRGATTILESQACPGDSISVKVTYDFDLTMPLLGAVVGGETFPLKAEVIDTILKSANSCP